MELTELRIGNKLMYKFKDEWKEISVSLNDFKYGFDKCFDKYKPILLNFEDFMSINEGDFLADKTGFVIFKNSYAYQFVYEDYRYMHLLQNLYFALTNKELIIK